MYGMIVTSCELVPDCIFEITKHTVIHEAKKQKDVVNWFQIVSLK